MRIKQSASSKIIHYIKTSGFILLYSMFLVACGTQVNTRVWDSAQVGGYPEHYDEKLMAELPESTTDINQTSFGIAFSGGGTRSAPATLGQIRALYSHNIFQKADYVSVVSGGAWAAVPFIYRPENVKAGNFFDEYIRADKLRDNNLQCNKNNSFGDAISESKFKFFSNNLYYMGLVGRHDETYARYLGNIFLKPVGLKKGFKPRFFTWTEDYYKKAVEPNNNGLDKEFHKVHDKSPYLIVNTTLMPFHSGNARNFLPVEITPAYVGVPINASIKFEEAVEDGDIVEINKKQLSIGGYVESFAYDTSPPTSGVAKKAVNQVTIDSHSKRFSLSDVLAATGAAPQQTLHKAGALKMISTNLGLPEFRYWGVNTNKSTDYTEYAHGDGGHLENLGVLPLLARKVERILVFINTPTRYRYKDDQLKIDTSFASLFDLKSRASYRKIYRRHPHNIVFERKAFDRLTAAFDKKLDRHKNTLAPLVHCDTYTVKNNSRYNISARYPSSKKGAKGKVYRPKICWVYLSDPVKWNKLIAKAKLGKELRNDILDRTGEFSHFPHYLTFFNDLPKLTVIDKSHAQVNLLSNLTHWTVEEVKDDLVRELGLKHIKAKHNNNEELISHNCNYDDKNCSCDDKKSETNQLIIEGSILSKKTSF